MTQKKIMCPYSLFNTRNWSQQGYFDLECVEKSHSPAGKVNGMCENMNKKPINMNENH